MPFIEKVIFYRPRRKPQPRQCGLALAVAGSTVGEYDLACGQDFVRPPTLSVEQIAFGQRLLAEGTSVREAVACFEDDFKACIAPLRLPIAHHRALRTARLLERLFGEERRRTKTIPHTFGERAVLKRMFVALARANQSWRRRVISAFELKQGSENRVAHSVPATDHADTLHRLPPPFFQQSLRLDLPMRGA